MNKFYFLVLLLTACAANTCAQNIVYINPGKYSYSYSFREQINCDKPCIADSFIAGKHTFAVRPNSTYFINTGASIGDCNNSVNSYIYIRTNSEGHVDSVCPKAAATFHNDTVVLKTQKITIKRNKYAGGLYASFSKNKDNTAYLPLPVTEEISIYPVQGLTYYLAPGGIMQLTTWDKCGNTPPDALIKFSDSLKTGFYFTVNEDRTLTTSEPGAITICGNKMTLNTATIRIDDKLLHSDNNKYSLLGYSECTLLNQYRDFVIVRSLLYFMIKNGPATRRIAYYKNF